MFGRPFSVLQCLDHYLAPVPVTRRWRRITPLELMHRLPTLGCVLYLPGDGMGIDPPHGCLLGARELEPLLRTHWLAEAGEVTTDGPHEWVECVDVRGVTQARLHLLPDTDYLAWDRLLAMGQDTSAPAPWRASRRFQPASARLCGFRWRPLACFQVFDACLVPAVSLAGQRVAAQVARAEALPLPLAVRV
jgi:hypothetical protein